MPYILSGSPNLGQAIPFFTSPVLLAFLKAMRTLWMMLLSQASLVPYRSACQLTFTPFPMPSHPPGLQYQPEVESWPGSEMHKDLSLKHLHDLLSPITLPPPNPPLWSWPCIGDMSLLILTNITSWNLQGFLLPVCNPKNNPHPHLTTSQPPPPPPPPARLLSQSLGT